MGVAMSKKNRDSQGQESAGLPETSRWSDYLWANLIFLACLAVLIYATRASCLSPGDDQTPALGIVLDQTLWFFGLLLGLGFMLVTLFDAAYEFFAGRAEQAPPAEDAPKA